MEIPVSTNLNMSVLPYNTLVFIFKNSQFTCFAQHVIYCSHFCLQTLTTFISQTLYDSFSYARHHSYCYFSIPICFFDMVSRHELHLNALLMWIVIRSIFSWKNMRFQFLSHLKKALPKLFTHLISAVKYIKSCFLHCIFAHL